MEKVLAILESMQGNISAMQGNISAMQGDISTMQGNISAMQGDISALQQKVTKIEIVQENITNQTLSLIREGIEGVNDKFHRLDRLEEAVEDHGDRIFALEQAVRK